MLMNLQWYYRIFMFPNIIDQPLVLQKYPNVSDWLGWQQILHILENSPPKLSTSQYRSKSPASWAQMEILQWSKLSIKSPCLWACHSACTCPHAEFWAILKVTHYVSSLFFSFKFAAELSSLLSSSSISCYHFPHTYISFVVVECAEAAAAAVVVPVIVFGLFLMVIQTVKCIFLREICVWVWCSFLIFSRIFCRICCITAVVVLIVVVDAVSFGAQV